MCSQADIHRIRFNDNTLTKFSITLHEIPLSNYNEFFRSFVMVFETNRTLRTLRIHLRNPLSNISKELLFRFLELLKENRFLKTVTFVVFIEEIRDFYQKLLEVFMCNKSIEVVEFEMFHFHCLKTNFFTEFFRFEKPLIRLKFYEARINPGIINSLPKSKNLIELGFSALDHNFTRILPLLKQSLISLKIREKIGNIAFNSLLKFMESNKTLKCLEIESLQEGLDLNLLLDSLKSNETLETLCFHSIENEYHSNIVFEIVKNTKIKNLYIDDLHHVPLEASKILEPLGNLEEIKLGRIFLKLENNTYNDLPKELPLLKKIVLRKVFLTSDVFLFLSEIVQRAKNLIELDFQNCDLILFREGTVEHFFNILSNNQSIRSIKFSDCCLNCFNKCLAELVMNSKTLRSFELYEREIGTEIVNLLEAIRESKTLERVRISSTNPMRRQIPKEVVNLVPEFLRRNSSITQLELFNDAEIDSENEILDALQYNSSLRSFNMSIKDLKEEIKTILLWKQKIKPIIKIPFDLLKPDVTLYFNKTPLRLHKVILYSRSEFFREIIKKDFKQTEFFIEDSETDLDVFEKAIKYMYGHETVLHSDICQKYKISQNSFDELFDNRSMSDVTFKLRDGSSIYLNKLILCSRNEYMKAMLLGGFEESTKNEVEIIEEHTDAFFKLMRYLYTNEIDFNTNIFELLFVSDKYMCYDLKDYLQWLLIENITIENVHDILGASVVCNCKALEIFCKDYIHNYRCENENTEVYESLEEPQLKILQRLQ
jgi:hypothetical protein